MDRTYKRFLLFFGAIVLIGLIYYFGLSRYISIEQLKANDAAIQGFISNHYVLAVLIYLTLFFCAIILSLPIVALFALAGGYLFGIGMGIVYAEIGATLGAVIAYSIYHLFLSSNTKKRYRQKFSGLEQQVKQDGANYLLMLQFLGVVPFFMINCVAVLANISVKTLAWTTAVGSLPFLLVYVIAGSQVRSVTSLRDLLSIRMILVLLLFALLAVLPVIIKKVRRRLGHAHHED